MDKRQDGCVARPPPRCLIDAGHPPDGAESAWVPRALPVCTREAARVPPSA